MKVNQIVYRSYASKIEYKKNEKSIDDIDVEMICRCCLHKSKTSFRDGDSTVKCPNCGVGHPVSEFS